MIDNEAELLCDAFLSSGIKREIGTTLKKIDQDVARGAKEQANENFRRALKLGAQLIIGQVYEPSNNLTVQENLRCKTLLHKRYSMSENGFIEDHEAAMGKQELEEFERLKNKAENCEHHI